MRASWRQSNLNNNVFEIYDNFVDDLAHFPKEQSDPRIVGAMYSALGLAGEAGEVVEKIKKWHRDGVIDEISVLKELGDVLYYLTSLTHSMGFILEDVAELNVEKLSSRRDRGVLHGSGDNR